MNIHYVTNRHVYTPKDRPDAIVVLTSNGQIFTEQIKRLELRTSGILITTVKYDMVHIDFLNEDVTVYMRHAYAQSTMTMFALRDGVWSPPETLPVKRSGLSGNVTSVFLYQLFELVTDN